MPRRPAAPGAVLARRLFHHKTRKQPFSTLLYLIALAQIAALVWWGFSSIECDLKVVDG